MKYDNLKLTENKRTIIGDISKINLVRNHINNINLNTFEFNAEEEEIVKKYIKDSICRLEFVNYDAKLRNLFDYLLLMMI